MDEQTDRERMDANNGRPWCDTCKDPACFSEIFGIRHTSEEYPFGIPEHLDPNSAVNGGHAVTMKDWFNTPLFEGGRLW